MTFSRKTVLTGAAAIVVAALCIRFPGTTSRPFHTDEAVNAFILGDLLSGEGYVYRAHDHHGPTLYYLAALPLRLAGIGGVAGMEAWMLRAVTVICGAATVAAVFLFRNVLGRNATFAAAGLIALAAPFVYYSGSFIHESLLILLTLLFAATFRRWRETGEQRAALLGGLLAGLMVATKETAPAIQLAILVAMLPGSPLPARRRIVGLTTGAGVAAAVVLLFFSDFLRHPERLSGLIDAVRQQTGRGLGDEHAHPWYTYAVWLGAPGATGLSWSGWLLAGFGGFGVWQGRRSPFLRACGVWAGLLFVFHSALPYKTPWLTLSFLLPLALAAGYGVAALFEKIPRRSVVAGIAALIAGLLLSETIAKSFREPVSPSNPLAYSPGSPDLDRLERDLSKLATLPGNAGIPVRVVAGDYWPLPWTLRHFPAGFQASPSADVLATRTFVICGPESVGEYAGTGSFETFESYEIRPGVRVFLAAPPPIPSPSPSR